MKTTLSIIAASALAASLAPAASAEIGSPVNVSIVRTADLDLTSGAGQRSLDQRLITAAHEVCDTASAVDLKARNAQRDCREEVLAEARARARLIAAGDASGTIALAATK